VPVTLVAFALTYALVPESSRPGDARLDPPGLISSSVAIGLLVFLHHHRGAGSRLGLATTPS
jgi:hypothetical protein